MAGKMIGIRLSEVEVEMLDRMRGNVKPSTYIKQVLFGDRAAGMKDIIERVDRIEDGLRGLPGMKDCPVDRERLQFYIDKITTNIEGRVLALDSKKKYIPKKTIADVLSIAGRMLKLVKDEDPCMYLLFLMGFGVGTITLIGRSDEEWTEAGLIDSFIQELDSSDDPFGLGDIPL